MDFDVDLGTHNEPVVISNRFSLRRILKEQAVEIAEYILGIFRRRVEHAVYVWLTFPLSFCFCLIPQNLTLNFQ